MAKPHGVGYAVIDVLPFLTGKPLDDIAAGYMRALRPSKVEVIDKDGTHDLMAMNWRVRIFMHGDLIYKIQQEVEVGLYGEIVNGGHLQAEAFERWAR